MSSSTTARPPTPNLRIQIKLTLAGATGKASTSTKSGEKKVWYLVGTSPKITVFRDMLRK
jgi:hypothetical protein